MVNQLLSVISFLESPCASRETRGCMLIKTSPVARPVHYGPALEYDHGPEFSWAL